MDSAVTSNRGAAVSLRGSVVDARVERHLPPIYSMLHAGAASLRCSAQKKNIQDIFGELSRTLHRIRQESIDEEIFDVIAGFEALTSPIRRTKKTIFESSVSRS